MHQNKKDAHTQWPLILPHVHRCYHPPQNEAESEPSAGKTHREEPAQPVLARIGGTSSKSSRAEYRFWLVLAIGAGAVGSFMAVVVFAVGQYRKVSFFL